MATISDRIKYAMELRGLKQADLVERTGISKGALSSYISGRYSPKQNNIYLISKALSVNEAWLMGADVPIDRIPLDLAVKLSEDESFLIELSRKDKSMHDRLLLYAKKLSELNDLENS